MNRNDYSSVDKLIDFGMGLSIAKQMTDTMNSAIGNMDIPGNKIPKNKSEVPLTFFIEIEGKPAGPFSEDEIKMLFKEKKITEDSLIWKQGMSAWDKIKNVPEALRLFILSVPFQEKLTDENKKN